MDGFGLNTFTSSTYGGVETDWLEDEDYHIFKFNIPGLKREDVTVQIVGENTLQVSGVRKVGTERFGKWHIKERPTGTFFRKFQLPSDVKPNEVVAIDDAGVLTVSVPKRKRYIRNIPISML